MNLDYFIDLLSHYDNVYVLFSGTFCNPCKKILPFFNELSGKYNNIKFIKIDVNESSDIVDFYNIKHIPTFIYFKNGNKIKEYTGISEKEIELLIR